tara:strand:- start:56 stop:436 length:381 start_codon:yes stop_codon:yes gene_type:complete
MSSTKEYKQQYYLKNREKYLERARRQRLIDPVKASLASKAAGVKRRAFKKYLLSQFPCYLCGLGDPDIIDWHHVNPEDKLFNASDTTKSHEKWWNEVLKCIPVCCNCHRKIHMNKLCLLPQTNHSE